ncbi:MAG: hypothetical protein ABW106_10790 [Steroidobacteraceae bacterium]
MMKRTALVLVVSVLALGCSDNDYRSNSTTAPPPSSGPSGGSSDFTAFVVSQYTATATSETAIPVAVDATNFTFADDTNPDAFNTVISTAP